MYEESFSNLPKVDLEHQIHLERYKKFIESRQHRKIEEGASIEKHHIWPFSLGAHKGYYREPWNIVKLTAREHYIAHLILWKCYEGKLAKAFFYMQNKNTLSGKCNSEITSRQYDKLREDVRNNMRGKKNPLYGKIPSKESLEKRKETRIRNFGSYKDSFKMSEATRMKLSNSKKGRSMPREGIEKIIEKLSIKVINLNTNEVFDSIKKAAHKYNISAGAISKCCRKIYRYKTVGGFFWCYYNDYLSGNYTISSNNGNRKKVICIETEEIFASIKEANLKYNILSSSICNCCKNRNKTAGGFHWQYYDTYIEIKNSIKRIGLVERIKKQ